MSSIPQTEVWQRGPVPGFEPLLMPVVHALLQAREDLERLVSEVPSEHVWVRPGGAASIGFHVRHTGGALDRLFTYARGETLSDAQKAALREEGTPGDPPLSLVTVLSGVNTIIDRALQQLAATSKGSLLDERKLGRAGLPTNVMGLLFHAAEHCTRHVGQAITTARIVKSL
jgi:DinB family protein